LLYSSDLELGETTKLMFEAIERCRPSRIVVDSVSEIRLLAQDSLRYRHQILALKHCIAHQGATVLLLDDLTVNAAAKLHQPAGVKLHHPGAHCQGGICGMAGGFARSRERSSPRAAQRRAAGAGLDGESAHRAIMGMLRCALALWASV